jgi:malonyl CoA-acyl carrier protein transacylase
MRWQISMVALALTAIGSMYGFARSPSFDVMRNLDVLFLFVAGFSVGVLTALAGMVVLPRGRGD